MCNIVFISKIEVNKDTTFSDNAKITMTKKNWFERLTSRCAQNNTLVFDAGSVFSVQVVKVKK